jgi:type IV pilus assembly protein PilA
MKTIIKTNRGFTLIELMITVAIIGILSAIALPMYQQYAVKAQMTEGMILAGAVKKGVAIYYGVNGNFPIDITKLEVNNNTQGDYIATVTVSNGDVVATFNGSTVHPILKNEILILHPAVDLAGGINWECSTSLKNTPSKVIYIPTTCSQ